MTEEKSQPPRSERRRSQRAFLRIGVVVERRAPHGAPFHEETVTLAVSAHGALVTLGHEVAINQTLMLTHRGTGQAQDSRVAYIGTAHAGKREVGLEFVEPAPKFWQIDFPPADWNPSEE